MRLNKLDPPVTTHHMPRQGGEGVGRLVIPNFRSRVQISPKPKFPVSGGEGEGGGR